MTPYDIAAAKSRQSSCAREADRVPNQGNGAQVCAMPAMKLSRVRNSLLGLDGVCLPHNESPPRGESFSVGKMEIPRERSLPGCHSAGALHSLTRD